MEKISNIYVITRTRFTKATTINNKLKASAFLLFFPSLCIGMSTNIDCPLYGAESKLTSAPVLVNKIRCWSIYLKSFSKPANSKQNQLLLVLSSINITLYFIV